MILLIAGSSGREASAAIPRPASATQPGQARGDTSWWEAAEGLLQKERGQYSTAQLTPEAVQELQVKGQQVTKLLTKLVNNRVQHGLDPSVSCHRMLSPLCSFRLVSSRVLEVMQHSLHLLVRCSMHCRHAAGYKGSQVYRLQCWAAVLTTSLGNKQGVACNLQCPASA